MVSALQDELEQMPTVWDYPHFIALLVVVVAVTASVGIWSAKQRGEVKERGNLLGLLPFLVIVVLHVSILYLLPALAVVVGFKHFVFEIALSPATFPTEFVEPSMRLAVLICLADNFADYLSVGKEVPLGTHAFQFLVLLVPSYYGVMSATWLVARVIAAGGGYDAEHVRAANGLFSVPSFHPNPTFNVVVVVSFILLATVISFALRLHRAGMPKAAELE
ncbi:MAG: hypothetical protein PVG79_08245 [Gemmatimonadales bacterium]|jgi:hypothetical protein